MSEGPRLFISHAFEDKPIVNDLFDSLRNVGFQPWTVQAYVQPGENWRAKVEEAIKTCDYFLAVVSTHTTARHGVYKTEWRQALEIAKTKPIDTVYVIPIRLDTTPVPEDLSQFRAIDYYTQKGWTELVDSLGGAPIPPLPQPIPPDALIQACSKGDCVVFVGAGLSMAAGYPGWKRTVEGLLNWAGFDHRFVEQDLANLYSISLLLPGQEDRVADAVLSALRRKDPTNKMLRDYLAEVFSVPANQPTPVHRLLPQIGFAAALTTNLDPLLEQTYRRSKESSRGSKHKSGSTNDFTVFTPQDGPALLTALAKGEFFILNLSGKLDRPETLLLSPGEYREAVAANRRYSEFLETLFLTRTVLFMGASLGGVLSALDAFHFQRSKSGARHYALIGVAGAEWQATASVLENRYNVEVLPYTATTTHAEVLAFAQLLTHEVHRARATQADAKSLPAAKEPPRLKRVCIENIGPFEAIELTLDPQWNVLLGDNGMGKSNVLRTIAVALCGRAAEHLADQLIRCGQPSGRIELELTDGTVTVTRLERTKVGVEVEANVQRELLGVERWLAIGFPALRHCGGGTLSGPMQTPTILRATTPQDLLPLVSGDPDGRIRDLQQFLVNIDYRSTQPEGRRLRDRIDDFFSVIENLTDGLVLHKWRVDRQTFQVFVNTDDGEIPLAALSQGTQSLMGWIGHLLLRLYEVYDNLEHPRQGHALVLVDEIDAHMHPAWQQSIVPKLSELFRNVQFVVTTHSPLVVTEVKRDQVILLEREVTTKQVVTRRLREATQGVGAGGLLTGELFGLRRTLDRQTQEKLDRKRQLASKQPHELSTDEREDLQKLDKELFDLGLNYEYRDPLYGQFLKEWSALNRAGRDWAQNTLSREQQEERAELVRKILMELKSGGGGLPTP